MLKGRKGKIFVISGPSGVGKDTVCNELLKRYDDLCMSISMTTRFIRTNETNGKDYYFVSNNEFEKRIKEDGFVEYTEIFGNFYGTPKAELEKTLNDGKNVLMILESEGAFNIKDVYPESTLIYILPPSLEVLKERLHKRKTESVKEINARFNNCINEIRNASDYDFCVINNTVEQAVIDIENIIDGNCPKTDKEILIKNLLKLLNQNKKTIVVNMLAGPGAGKTTSAWAIASALKSKGIIVEYVPEYAKELVWDNKLDLLDGSYQNELNIYNEQKKRIDRLIGKVDVIVTDRPLILSNIYIDKEINSSEDYKKYIKMVSEDFKSYDNRNFVIKRSKEYVKAGRMQTEKEARALDTALTSFLDNNNIEYTTFNISEKFKIAENIATEVLADKNII